MNKNSIWMVILLFVLTLVVVGCTVEKKLEELTKPMKHEEMVESQPDYWIFYTEWASGDGLYKRNIDTGEELLFIVSGGNSSIDKYTVVDNCLYYTTVSEKDEKVKSI